MKDKFKFWKKNFFSLKSRYPFTLSLFFFNILLITIIRWVCDFFWIGNLNYFFNIYVWFLLLCVYTASLPISTDCFIRKLAGLKYDKSRLLNFFEFSSKLWWLVIPVPILNGLFHADKVIAIKFFRYIPTFMEAGNYMPIGMVVVIPFFIIFMTMFIRKMYGVSLGKSFFYGSLGLFTLYVIFYQWLWRMFNYLLFTLMKDYRLSFGESYPVSMSIFIIATLFYLLVFIKPSYKVFNKHPLYSYYLFVLVNIIILSIRPFVFFLTTV